MKEGPNISLIGSLIGDSARANMLSALLGGKALTATELANEAGITRQTASSHLSKLYDGGLIAEAKQGRHKYFRLAGPEIVELLERLLGLAEKIGHSRTRTGPKDKDLRTARVCYDHLAGTLGVSMFHSFHSQGFLKVDADIISITPKGAQKFQSLGIDTEKLTKARRPICKSCLDWSERQYHLAGGLGAALLQYFIDQHWIRRSENSRSIFITPKGRPLFEQLLTKPFFNL